MSNIAWLFDLALVVVIISTARVGAAHQLTLLRVLFKAMNTIQFLLWLISLVNFAPALFTLASLTLRAYAAHTAPIPAAAVGLPASAEAGAQSPLTSSVDVDADRSAVVEVAQQQICQSADLQPRGELETSKAAEVHQASAQAATQLASAAASTPTQMTSPESLGPGNKDQHTVSAPAVAAARLLEVPCPASPAAAPASQLSVVANSAAPSVETSGGLLADMIEPSQRSIQDGYQSFSIAGALALPASSFSLARSLPVQVPTTIITSFEGDAPRMAEEFKLGCLSLTTIRRAKRKDRSCQRATERTTEHANTLQVPGLKLAYLRPESNDVMDSPLFVKLTHPAWTDEMVQRATRRRGPITEFDCRTDRRRAAHYNSWSQYCYEWKVELSPAWHKCERADWRLKLVQEVGTPAEIEAAQAAASAARVPFNAIDARIVKGDSLADEVRARLRRGKLYDAAELAVLRTRYEAEKHLREEADRLIGWYKGVEEAKRVRVEEVGRYELRKAFKQRLQEEKEIEADKAVEVVAEFKPEAKVDDAAELLFAEFERQEAEAAEKKVAAAAEVAEPLQKETVKRMDVIIEEVEEVIVHKVESAGAPTKAATSVIPSTETQVVADSALASTGLEVSTSSGSTTPPSLLSLGESTSSASSAASDPMPSAAIELVEVSETLATLPSKSVQLSVMEWTASVAVALDDDESAAVALAEAIEVEVSTGVEAKNPELPIVASDAGFQADNNDSLSAVRFRSARIATPRNQLKQAFKHISSIVRIQLAQAVAPAVRQPARPDAARLARIAKVDDALRERIALIAGGSEAAAAQGWEEKGLTWTVKVVDAMMSDEESDADDDDDTYTEVDYYEDREGPFSLDLASDEEAEELNEDESDGESDLEQEVDDDPFDLEY